MNDMDQEIEQRFMKLMLSTVLKTIDSLHPDVDATTTVQKHMLNICDGVRQRALAAAGDGADPEQATAHVDKLTSVINAYFDYSSRDEFGALRLIPPTRP